MRSTTLIMTFFVAVLMTAAPIQEAKADDGGLPQCDSDTAKGGLKQTIENGAYSNIVKLQLLDMDKLTEVSYDAQAHVRVCIGEVVLNTGDGKITYKISLSKSNPSQSLLFAHPIDFELPEVTPDKDMDVDVEKDFQGNWTNKEHGLTTLTFDGNYVTFKVGPDPAQICRVLNYSKEKATFSFCRTEGQAAVDLNCDESPTPHTITDARTGRRRIEYYNSSACWATSVANATLQKNGTLEYAAYTFNKGTQSQNTISSKASSDAPNSGFSLEPTSQSINTDVPKHCEQRMVNGKSSGVYCEQSDGTWKLKASVK